MSAKELAKEKEPIEDRNLIEIQPLPSPRSLKQRLPIAESAAETVLNARQDIRDVLYGRDSSPDRWSTSLLLTIAVIHH